MTWILFLHWLAWSPNLVTLWKGFKAQIYYLIKFMTCDIANITRRVYALYLSHHKDWSWNPYLHLLRNQDKNPLHPFFVTSWTSPIKAYIYTKWFWSKIVNCSTWAFKILGSMHILWKPKPHLSKIKEVDFVPF